MRYRHNHKEKINLKRRKAIVAYYRKLKYEKKNAGKQVMSNPNITPENLTVRMQYLRQSIYDLIRVAYACDVLGIPIPQRLYEQTDNKIGFKRNSEKSDMLNYDTEKDVNTVTYADMGKIRNQYMFRPTALQLGELKAVNQDRKDVDVATHTIVSETCGFANYRAYLNAHDGWEVHDWAIEKGELFSQYCVEMGGTTCGENTVTWSSSSSYGEITEHDYYNSEAHYEAMVRDRYNYIGVSNVCSGDSVSSQFDYFIDFFDNRSIRL